MGADDCLFCKMIAGRVPVTKVYEDEDVLAFLDIQPISDGHTLVIPKQHFESLHDCPPEILGRVASRLGKVARAVMAATGFDGYNVLSNNGRAAGQLVEHLHFHVIGRNKGDGLFQKWPACKYEQGKIEIIAERIRKKM
jgi:histidine triad (HIT) family protein